MPDPLSAFTFPTPWYPYATGYASLDDVKARINAGTWDPDKPTAAPNAAQVQQLLMEATSNIDAALRTRGYFVPLEPIAGWVAPAGMASQLYQGIGLGAWLMLKGIAAAYAAHYVELTRHGSHGTQHDPNAEHFMTLYDDFLTRIESGADNLFTYGVAGDFPPEINPAKGVLSGNLGATLADPNFTEGPAFTKYMNLGSGYENVPIVPQGSPSNSPFTGI